VRGANLTLASYGQGRMAALTLERGCRLNTLYRNDVLGIDCDATFGSSGAHNVDCVQWSPRRGWSP
jgi:protease YdgD